MERREFIKASALSAASVSLGANTILGSTQDDTKNKDNNKFNLNYASHFGMFKNNAGEDLIDQLKFMADQGIPALEDNGMKDKSVDVQEKVAKTMAELGMQMGIFVAHKIYWKEPNLTSGKKNYQEEFLKDIKDSVEVAKRVNAKWMTVVPGHVDPRLRMEYQTANVVDSLKRASEILEPHGLVMVIESLNFYNHPGMFLTVIPQAYQICKAVNSPSCKILDDLYHQQISEGNLIPNIDLAWDEIGYFQIGDNPGRKEPTTGEVNFHNVFKHIYEKGYTGILGMEHGNSKPGKEGELAVIEAYRKCDDF
ncbi:Hydroxypyruvate isomerase [hydrothermal vent metagenome]|uniref:Hydroxypyruvate isomerase n=1 Tax=hydrothermal vent metagenome TaxID=652676 RepID=A0A3B1CM26_9ZZZZ